MVAKEFFYIGGAAERLKILPIHGIPNQRINGPVNAHLISGHCISTKIQSLDKMAEKTSTFITYNPQILVQFTILT